MRMARPKRWPFTIRRKAPLVANKPPPPPCWKNCLLWTAKSSRPIPCTVSVSTPGPSWKKAVIICSRSKATNPACSSKPKAWMPCSTPPFYPHRSGTRTHRDPAPASLCHRTAHRGLSPCPNLDRAAERADDQKDQHHHYRITLLLIQCPS